MGTSHGRIRIRVEGLREFLLGRRMWLAEIVLSPISGRHNLFVDYGCLGIG